MRIHFNKKTCGLPKTGSYKLELICAPLGSSELHEFLTLKNIFFLTGVINLFFGICFRNELQKMHIAKMKTRKNVNQTIVVRNKPLTSPTAFAFSVFYNTVRRKCCVFYTIALPVYLRH